jgi:hypothetical protein
VKKLDAMSLAVGAIIGGVLLLLVDSFYLDSPMGAFKSFLIGAAIGASVQGGERLTGAS